MFGEYLIKLRKEANLSLKEISDKTRIQLDYLSAIEKEEFDKIPGEVFIKGYIKEYLRTLSVDPTEALNLYNKLKIEEVNTQKTLIKLPSRTKLRPKILGSFLILVIILILIIILLVVITPFYKKLVNHGTNYKKSTYLMEPSKGVKNKSIENSKKTDNILSLLKPGTPEQSVYEKHLLKVSVTEKTWLSINIDDTIRYSFLMEPGQIRQWTGEKKFLLKIGNPKGVKITFDGENIDIPGENGQVINLTLPDNINQ